MRGIARKANNPQNTAYQHTPKPCAVPKVFVNIQIHFRYKGYIFRSFWKTGAQKRRGYRPGASPYSKLILSLYG